MRAISLVRVGNYLLVLAYNALPLQTRLISTNNSTCLHLTYIQLKQRFYINQYSNTLLLTFILVKTGNI